MNGDVEGGACSAEGRTGRLLASGGERRERLGVHVARHQPWWMSARGHTAQKRPGGPEGPPARVLTCVVLRVQVSG